MISYGQVCKENNGVVALSSLYGGISTASGIKRRRQATKGIIMTDKKETDKKADMILIISPSEQQLLSLSFVQDTSPLHSARP